MALPEYPQGSTAGDRPEEIQEELFSSRDGYVDDGSVVHALDSAVVWGAMAVSRALVDEGRDPGDELLDRLLAIQTAIAELREDWTAPGTDSASSGATSPRVVG